MSYKSKSQQKMKAYCKVCHDAGKPESEYTSHFVRSSPGPAGVVICPTLLTQQCRYCQKDGHTVKFCPTLADRQKKEKKMESRREFENNKTKQQTTTGNNSHQQKKTNKPMSTFSALQYSSDSDTEEQQNITDTNSIQLEMEFPSLGQSNQQPSSAAVSYASIASKQIADITSEAVEVAVVQPEPTNIKMPTVPMIQPRNPRVNKNAGRSWADWTDTDSDDDEEDEDF
jgi:hypothetical protein